VAKGIELEDLATRIAALGQALRQDGIRLVCLFGSLAEGRAGRDIDLAVLFSDYHFGRYIRR
jgi:predicted nucleotidyltransferase